MDEKYPIDSYSNNQPQHSKLSEEEKWHIFECEFEPQFAALYNYAYYLCRDEALARDLVQDTMLRAYEHIENYRVGSNAKAWLFRILKNGYLNETRRVKTAPKMTELDDVRSHHESEENNRYANLHQEIFQDMMGDEVKFALDSLDPIFREILIFYDIERIPYQEIAEILNKPIGTVRSRLNRARSLMREALADYAQKEGYKKKKHK